MKFVRQKLFLSFYSLFVILLYSVEAAERDIQVFVEFRQALAIDNVTDMDYGIIDYVQGAGANNIVLSPSGSLSCSNRQDYNCPAVGQAAGFHVSGSFGSLIHISCDSEASLANQNGETLVIDRVRLKMLGGPRMVCRGVGVTALTTILMPRNDDFQMGARLKVAATGIPSAGLYSTAQRNGDPITVRVVYQ